MLPYPNDCVFKAADKPKRKFPFFFRISAFSRSFRDRCARSGPIIFNEAI